LWLTKSIAKHIKEIIRIGSSQAIEKFVAVFDEFGFMVVTIRIQTNLIKLKGFKPALGAILFFGRLYCNQGFGLELCAGHPAGHFVGAGV
jgi:hypothetical protein